MRIAACFLLAAGVITAQAVPELQKVTAHGVAEVSAKPDQVQIDIGVVTQAPSAQEAATTNAKQVAAVIADLKKAIGAGGEIQTVNYYVHPNYNHPREGGTPRISGYVATNVVRVTSGDVANAGKLVDAATGTGANNIHGIQFSLKDESALRAKALGEAVKQARSNADAMAAALGMKVKNILSVQDGAAPPPVQPLRRDMMMAQRAEAVSTPVEPGTIKIRAEATLTASLAP